MTMFAGLVHEAAHRVSDAVLVARSMATALAFLCCSLGLSPPWPIRCRWGDWSAPFAMGEICMVCLGEISSDGKLQELPECGHCFHAECIETWLGYCRTCPLCRTTVSSPSSGREKLLALAKWALRLLMECVFKWMDKHYDSKLALMFCSDSETPHPLRGFH